VKSAHCLEPYRSEEVLTIRCMSKGLVMAGLDEWLHYERPYSARRFRAFSVSSGDGRHGKLEVSQSRTVPHATFSRLTGRRNTDEMQ
jgi:hypothetical protein